MNGRASRAARDHAAAVDGLAERQRWLAEHPTAGRRLARIAHDLASLDRLADTERQAAALEARADRLARQRPAAAAAAAERAAEEAAARRVDELQAQLAARWTGRLRGGDRQQAEAEINQLRVAYPDLWYPAERRDQRWTQRQTHAQQLDGGDVAQLRDQADQARYDNQHSWQGLNRPAPAPLPTPSLECQPEPPVGAVRPQHPHPTMHLQPGLAPQPGWYHQPAPGPLPIEPDLGIGL